MSAVEIIAAYAERLWDNRVGWVFVASGEPYDDGKVHHRGWAERAFAWPRHRDELVETITTMSTGRDVFVTPGMSENPLATRRSAATCRPRTCGRTSIASLMRCTIA